jgi:hypothetical protein
MRKRDLWLCQLEIEDHSTPDDIRSSRVQNPAGKQMERVNRVTHHDSMACIGPAIVPNDHVRSSSKQVDQPPFSLITPCGAKNDRDTHITPDKSRIVKQEQV